MSAQLTEGLGAFDVKTITEMIYLRCRARFLDFRNIATTFDATDRYPGDSFQIPVKANQSITNRVKACFEDWQFDDIAPQSATMTIGDGIYNGYRLCGQEKAKWSRLGANYMEQFAVEHADALVDQAFQAVIADLNLASLPTLEVDGELFGADDMAKLAKEKCARDGRGCAQSIILNCTLGINLALDDAILRHEGSEGINDSALLRGTAPSTLFGLSYQEIDALDPEDHSLAGLCIKSDAMAIAFGSPKHLGNECYDMVDRMVDDQTGFVLEHRSFCTPESDTEHHVWSIGSVDACILEPCSVYVIRDTNPLVVAPCAGNATVTVTDATAP